MKCYTEGDLYKQLKYFQFMFDIPKFEHSRKYLITSIIIYDEFCNFLPFNLLKCVFHSSKIVIRTKDHMEIAFRELREHVEKTLKRSAYQNVKLADIFRKMMPNENTTSK